VHFRLASGHGLNYTSQGAGRCLALLHPIGVDGSFWAPIADALAATCRVVCIDLPGHGGSDVRRASLDAMAADVAELLATVGGDKPVLGGCSLGAMVAQGVALHAPSLLGGLVLADGNATLAPEGRAMMQKRAAEARHGMPRTLETTLTRWFSADFRARAPQEVQRVAALLLAGDPIVHAWTWEAIAALDHAPRLGQIALPTLVICGSADVSCPPAASQAIARAIPGARYEELVGAAHMAPLEQVDAFVALVRAFVRKLD
jgi:3-oxoadipate enol-lactonase